METIGIKDKNKEVIRELYEEILNTGKLEQLNQLFSEEYAGPRGIKGPAGFAQAIYSLRLEFSDISWTVEDLVAEADEVVVRWSWTGTNTNSFDGFPQVING
jgi:predicted ester cyclase